MTVTKRDLPELPAMSNLALSSHYTTISVSGYTADQMQAYARAAQAMPRECRMLTEREIGIIADRCDGLGDLAYERELFGKFCEVNNLTMRVEP